MAKTLHVELQGDLPFELKVPDKVLAEQKLFYEIEIGKKSAEAQGYINFNDSQKAISEIENNG